MSVKFCRQCGFQLHPKARKCLWCKAPVKKRRALPISIFAIVVCSVFAMWLRSDNALLVASPPTPIQPKVAEVPKKENQNKDRNKFLSRVYVRKNIANLRKNPSIKSPTLRKLRKGQRLIQVNRSGNWVQVVSDGGGDKRGWVHASLVREVKSHALQKQFESAEFKTFIKSFNRFNNRIKGSKGMTFFMDVVYLGNGVVQVTATDVLLSAPKIYKKKYFEKLTGMWLDLHKTPATIRIVDATGRLQLREVRKK